MEPPRERACPNCGAPAAVPQRWCLECGHELPGPRRAGIRSAVGIATTLAVLVGAASAGGYTILQHDKVPPPPATTVAQAPPATSESLPPATQEPAPYSYTPPTTLPNTATSDFGHGPRAPVVPLGSSGSRTNGGTTTPRGSPSSGSVAPETHTTTTTTTPPKPQFALTDIALGAAAVVYAPYAAADTDLGDPSRAVDGSTRTVWKAPAAADPTAPPQLGIYVDLAGRQKLRRLELQTPTPGMSIEIYGARSGPPASITDPGWDHLASRAGIAAHTKVKLGDLAYRYLLV
jgi:hypothetical protein